LGLGLNPGLYVVHPIYQHGCWPSKRGILGWENDNVAKVCLLLEGTVAHAMGGYSRDAACLDDDDRETSVKSMG